MSSCLSILVLFLYVGSVSFAIGQTSGSPDERRALIARDVCTVGASFVHAEGAEDVSYEAGHFKVVSGRGVITVFEGGSQLLKMEGFDYQSYQHCLDHFIESFEASRRSEEAKDKLEAFNAGYELSTFLYIGTCLQSAAQGGLAISGMEMTVMESQDIKNYLTSVSKSIKRRTSRIANRRIDFQLENKYRLYSYYPGRYFPYFDQSTVESSLEALFDATNASGEEYARLGATVGRMERFYFFVGGLSYIQRTVFSGSDPSRQARASTYLPTSLKCLMDGYNLSNSDLQQGLDQIGNPVLIQTPDISSMYYNTYSVGSFEPYRKVFYASVTSKIRAALRQH